MVTGESEAHFWQETRRCSHLPVKQQFGKLRKVGRIRFLSSFYKFLLCSRLSYRQPQWLLRKWGNNHLVLSVLKPFKNNVLPLVYLLEPVKILLFKCFIGDFPGCLVVQTWPSNVGDTGSIPTLGATMPHASWPKNQNIKQKQYCNKVNKDFKNDLPKKKKRPLKNTL